MDYKDKKLTVLHQLSQEAESISLPELIEKLGGNYVERSVRRWLTEMVGDGLVEKIGHKRGTKYQVIHRSNQKKKETASPKEDPSGCFGTQSRKVIEQIRRPIYERNPVPYADDWFSSYQPNTTFYIPLEYRSQLHKAGKRSEGKDPADTYVHQIFNRPILDIYLFSYMRTCAMYDSTVKAMGIDEISIAGLGITSDQLTAWLKTASDSEAVKN